MRANIDMTRGLIFADAISAALAGKMGRGAAQQMVKTAAAKVRETEEPLRKVLAAAGAPAALLDSAFDLGPATAAAASVAGRALRQAEAVKRTLRKL